MSKRILIVLTSHDRNGPTDAANATPGGFYLPEVAGPYFIFEKAGFTVDFISPKGGKTHADGVDLDDADNAAFWNNPELRMATEQTLSPRSVRASDYAAIFYAGGHATMWDFPESEELSTLAAQIYEQGGVVAAVCHGPSGLLNIKLKNDRYLVQGKNVSAFTDDEERVMQMFEKIPFSLSAELEKRGAYHFPVPNFEKQVIISERLVTGQNPASANGCADALVALLKGVAA